MHNMVLPQFNISSVAQQQALETLLYYLCISQWKNNVSSSLAQPDKNK